MAFNKLRSVLFISLVMVAAIVAGPTMAVAQTAGQTEATSEPMTILLMVSDARGDVATDAGAADVMVVVHLDPSTQSCRALNILPNTGVELEGVGSTRISQSLATGGTDVAVSAVESYLDVEIDNYGVIDLDGVIMAIDLVGGVTVSNPEAFSVGSNNFPAGEITLSGEQALVYARYTGDSGSTVTRLDRQKALVQGLIGTASSAGLSFDSVPASLQASAADIQDHIVTDVTLDNALAIADAYSTCMPNEQTVETITFASEGPQLDAATEDEQVIGVADAANVQAHVEWLLEGGPVPQQ